MSVPEWYGESSPGTAINIQDARYAQEAGPHPLAHRTRVARNLDDAQHGLLTDVSPGVDVSAGGGHAGW